MNNTSIQVGKRFFDLTNPHIYEYDIEEIAHSLDNICRFTGHTTKFYSVLEHSLLVYLIASNDKTALLHDASEAYVGDVSSPLKKLLPEYKKIEDNVQLAIANYFGLKYPYPEHVMKADMYALKFEREVFLPTPADSSIWDDFDDKYDLYDGDILTRVIENFSYLQKLKKYATPKQIFLKYATI
jgi:5'-deoxynucleotidase YfbR-like HD superfamily hydrolase